MKGIYFELGENKVDLMVTLKPIEFSEAISQKILLDSVAASKYASLHILTENIKNACVLANEIFKDKGQGEVTERIGEKRDAEFSFRISDDAMSATLAMKAPYGGKIPSVKMVRKLAHDQSIVKGVGKRHIANLLRQVKAASPGETIEEVIAKGLPPRRGKPSKVTPLVPNALERVLKPQTTAGDRVDMRNLGDVICVKAGTEVVRRHPPTAGRPGFNVTGTVLPAESGEWQPLTPGEGTVISDHDENLLIAEIAGMPKFKNGSMMIDDTFVCKGVNVGTGNIKYDGAVLVNGDVTEKMVIIATGDVTINGFVESATIQSGGDIIITEGAMGKVNEASTEHSTRLVAQGGIHLQHGQGLDIVSYGNVSIGRQLAYSTVSCTGSLTVGPMDNPNGNLFSCDIQVQGAVRAGTLGAVSGSHLNIDFSLGFNTLLERKDALDELLKQLKRNNVRHKDKIDLIRSKFIPPEMQDRVDDAIELFRSESNLLHWMEQKVEQMRNARDDYQSDIKLEAQKRLYPGVSVKLNNRTWRADKEYGRAKVAFKGHKWEYEPIV